MCFFMELLMHGLLPELLIGLKQEVTQYGRDALMSAIQAKRTFYNTVLAFVYVKETKR